LYALINGYGNPNEVAVTAGTKALICQTPAAGNAPPCFIGRQQ
jgi:hypothetical protein